MPRPLVRVAKVGGSLFDLTDLKSRLSRWLAQQPSAANILIAGGGPLADAVREMDRLHDLGEARSHWLCLDVMRITAGVLHAMLPGSESLNSLGDLENALAERRFINCVLDPRDIISGEDRLPGTHLPHSWQVTSDSVAARVAELVSANELVLLKSALPADASFTPAAECAYVDEFFPTVAAKLPVVRCVNLRDDTWPECQLRMAHHDLR